METKMRKISKVVFYPTGDGGHDARPRGISGATITSWGGSYEIDLDALLSKRGDQVSIGGAAYAPVSDRVLMATNPLDGTVIDFAQVEDFLTVAVV
jgi:hypothetical protein